MQSRLTSILTEGDSKNLKDDKLSPTLWFDYNLTTEEAFSDTPALPVLPSPTKNGWRENSTSIREVDLTVIQYLLICLLFLKVGSQRDKLQAFIMPTTVSIHFYLYDYYLDGELVFTLYLTLFFQSIFFPFAARPQSGTCWYLSNANQDNFHYPKKYVFGFWRLVELLIIIEKKSMPVFHT